MSENYTTLVACCRESYPDCSTTLALSYLNQIMRNLCRTIPLYRTSAQISLTAATQEYSLSDTVGQIQQVIYESSTTGRRVLKHHPLDYLNQDDEVWRYRSDGEPNSYYVTETAASAPSGALKIGFDPTPITTTSGGYPIVTIYYSELPADFVGADSSPQGLERPNVLVYGANMLYAESRKMWEDVSAWKQLFDKEHSRQWFHVNGRSQYSPPRSEPRSLRRLRSKV